MRKFTRKQNDSLVSLLERARNLQSAKDQAELDAFKQFNEMVFEKFRHTGVSDEDKVRISNVISNNIEEFAVVIQDLWNVGREGP